MTPKGSGHTASASENKVNSSLTIQQRRDPQSSKESRIGEGEVLSLIVLSDAGMLGDDADLATASTQRALKHFHRSVRLVARR